VTALGLRTATPVAGFVLAASLALWPAAGDISPGLPLAIGGLALCLYVVGVLGLQPAALPWSLALLALEYVVSLPFRGIVLDPAAPLYALAFFVTSELGWLSLEVRRGLGPWPARLLSAAALALAGAALGWLSLLTPTLPVPSGLGLTAFGVLAASATLAALAWLGAGRHR
jgi:hypothetical protein